jgi:hypothetical protein
VYKTYPLFIMEEVFRSLVGRLNESVRGYLKPRRKSSRLPVQVSIQPKIQTTSLVKNRLAETYTEKKKEFSTFGETYDISREGISFIVPFIRLGENYLVSDGTVLSLMIELPDSQLMLEAIGCRYEQIDPDSSAGGFLVGAKIIGMSEKDRVLFEEYLESQKLFRKNKVSKNIQWGLDLTRP